ncbi:hypothetical protein R3P38DRAFT_3234161 [Favolaschia claudopus]|uniref:Uncharacterized protein n=1 Tax=Favolaschia claudopus TaxID=2862362 RepID=A0AAV9ZH51_9AGAR
MPSASMSYDPGLSSQYTHLELSPHKMTHSSLFPLTLPPLRSSHSLSASVVAHSQLRRTLNPTHIKFATSPPKFTVVRSATSRLIPPLPSTLLNITLPASQLDSAVSALITPPNRLTQYHRTRCHISTPPPRFPTPLDTDAERQVSAGCFNADISLPFPTSSPFDCTPAIATPKSASFPTTADLARYIVLDTRDDVPPTTSHRLFPRYRVTAPPSSRGSPHSSSFTPSAPPSTPAQAVTYPPDSDSLDTPSVTRMASRPPPFRSPRPTWCRNVFALVLFSSS